MDRFNKSQAPDCIKCQFKQNCFVVRLDAATQKVWSALKLGRKFTDEEEIYAECQKPLGIYTVCKGRAKLYSTDARGQQMINWIRHPGDTFGHIALFSEKEYTSDAKAMGETVISFVDAKTLEAFMDSHPQMYRIFLRKIANEMRVMQYKVNDTAYKPARSKVAKALINAVSYKSRNTANPAIHGLKRTEIAEITGLALETVVRTLADMEKRNIIKRETKAIKILDYPTLVRIADPHAKKQD